jgi:hypothetical protein
MHLEQRVYWTYGIIGTTGTTGIAETTGQSELRESRNNRKTRTTGICWQEGPLHPAPIWDAHRIAAWILNKFWIRGLPIDERWFGASLLSYFLWYLMCWFNSFVVFVYIKYVFPKQLMVLNGIMYFQTIAGGANEKLSRQGKDWNMSQKNNDLVARCHSLCLSL